MNFWEKFKMYLDRKRIEHRIYEQERNAYLKQNDLNRRKFHKASCTICSGEYWICDDYLFSNNTTEATF